MRWINIVPLFPQRMEDMIEKAVRVSRETGFKEYALILTLHAEGEDPMEKIRIQAPLYAKFKHGLEAVGLKCGILFQTTVGHSFVSCQSPLPFQHAVMNNGSVSRWCMLDPAYRSYLCDAVRMLMKEEPPFVLVDDDFRMSHDIDRVECFCPLHTELFNRLNGTTHTPDSLREAFNTSLPDSPFRRAFREMQIKTLSETAELIRKTMDEINPKTQAILCLCGNEADEAHLLAKKFAGTQAVPAVRASNSMFLEPDMKLLPLRMQRTRFMRCALADIPEMLDESDTCPHNRYSKCVASLHAHLTGAILCGLTGGKLWLTPTICWEDELDKPYYRLFARYHAFYDTLQETLKNAKCCGISNAVNRYWLSAKPSWTMNALGLFGVPVNCDSGDTAAIQTLAGKEVAEAFSDEEMKRLLGGKLLLDGPAAEVFCRRGFEEYLGVHAGYDDYKFSSELDDRGTAINAIWGRFPKVQLSAPATGTEIFGSLVKNKYFKSAEKDFVAPGATIFANSLGGKVAVTARCVDLRGLQNYMLTPGIRDFLIRILEKLDQEALPYVVSVDQECYVQQFSLENGDILLSVFNLSYDLMENVPVRTKRKIKNLTRLAPSGLWEKVNMRETAGGFAADISLAAYEPVILRFSAVQA